MAARGDEMGLDSGRVGSPLSSKLVVPGGVAFIVTCFSRLRFFRTVLSLKVGRW